jgi:cellulose synthase/poly-beta-1,6-N-acetylglucosamine synthase-like glycosyltransferase
MLAVTTISLVGCYGLLALLCYIILLRPWPKHNSTNRPFISVVVACRNEAENLPACLHSLAGLSYPRERLQIIFVDDGSRDESAAILQAFASQHAHVNVIQLARQDKSLPGKAGAVLEGVSRSQGEFIFLTDADCMVPPHWIEAHLSYFQDQVGIVGGFTLLEPTAHENNWFARIQSLDWLFLLTVASAAGRVKRPLSWMGNNLAFRKSVYDGLGGYRALGPSLVEDFSLLNAVAKQARWRIVLHNEKQGIVLSRPEKSIAALYEQRKRWALGVRPVHPLGKVLILVSGLTRPAIFLTLFFSFQAALLALLFLMVADTLILSYNMQKLQCFKLLKGLPGFELYFFLLMVVMPLAYVLDRSIVWKDERYPSH